MCLGDIKENYWVVAEFIVIYMRRMQISCCFPGFNLTVQYPKPYMYQTFFRRLLEKLG